MSKGVSKDLNGDGKMDIKEDLFGCITQADCANSFLVGAGEKLVSKDENDYPVITFGNERIYQILDAVSELMLDEEIAVQLHRYEGKFPIYEEQVKMFSEKRALFSWIKMRIVENLRSMETDFGIIPVPKFESSQLKYYTHMNPHTATAVSIPKSNGDLERTGMILEDLCAESRYTVQPAYYEINLRGKYARDDESNDMLDIILNNTVYDVGYVYNFGNFALTILWYTRDKKTEYVSTFEQMKDLMQVDIDKTVEKFKEIDE